MNGPVPAARVMLGMTTVDAAATVEHCLAAAIPYVGAVCLRDLGSTDGTPELARRILAAAGLPWRIVLDDRERPGSQRGHTYALCRRLAEQLGWDTARSWALLLAGDLCPAAGAVVDPRGLDADLYAFAFPDPAPQPLLVRLSLGPGDLATRLQRDGDLPAPDLAMAIERADPQQVTATTVYAPLADATPGVTPGDANGMFALGQALFHVQRDDEARAIFAACAEADGGELGWYAAMQVGMCSLRLGEWDQAVEELQAAWRRRPWRAEPLHLLAHAAREHEDFSLALRTAEQAAGVPLPHDDALFVHLPSHEWGPLETLAISALDAGSPHIGRDACEALVHSRTVPAPVRERAASHSAWYARPLPLSFDRPLVLPSHIVPVDHVAYNASIERRGDGYMIVNRVLNRDAREPATTWYRDPRWQYHSRNIRIDLDAALRVLGAQMIDEAILRRVSPNDTARDRVFGLEDIRIVRWNGDWWFVGGSSNFSHRNLPRVVLGRFDAACASVEHLVPLSYTCSTEIEKNWLPVVQHGRLLLLYSSDPTILLEPDPQTGVCVEVQRTAPSANLGRYRGSSALLSLGDRYLYLAHEMVVAGRVIYLHRFVEMDRTLTIRRASAPFTFRHTGVEYSCGLCLSHDGATLLITHSVEEQQSWLAGIPLEAVDDLLRPITAMAPAIEAPRGAGVG